MKILVLLVYYERPQMVRNALESLRKQGGDWTCTFIDDGSPMPGRPIVEREFPDLLPRMEFVRIEESMAEKIWNGGSSHPAAMNAAIMDSDAKAVVLLCDDDALVPGYLPALAQWFTDNPGEMWCYCHVHLFDPSKEPVPEKAVATDNFLNAQKGRIFPSCVVDSSQVAFRRRVVREAGVRFPDRNTANNDMKFYQEGAKRLGACPWNGMVGQFKGVHKDQMGNRHPTRVYKVEAR